MHTGEMEATWLNLHISELPAEHVHTKPGANLNIKDTSPTRAGRSPPGRIEIACRPEALICQFSRRLGTMIGLQMAVLSSDFPVPIRISNAVNTAGDAEADEIACRLVALNWSSRRLKQTQGPQMGRQCWKASQCSQRMLTWHPLRLRCACLGTRCQRPLQSNLCMPPHLPRLLCPAKPPHMLGPEVCPLLCVPSIRKEQCTPKTTCNLAGDE